MAHRAKRRLEKSWIPVLIAAAVVTVFTAQSISASISNTGRTAGARSAFDARGAGTVTTKPVSSAVASFATTASFAGVHQLVDATAGTAKSAARHFSIPRLDAPYPVGALNEADPSGRVPPGASEMAGYTLDYVNDFTGTSLPTGWAAYDGVPSGDPGGQFASSHVSVSGGLLRLSTWRDSAYANQWATGGVCQCGLGRTYGAYFVRSRVTGPGPTAVELLWPVAPTWPPEIDFSETRGVTSGTSATLHYGSTNQAIQRSLTIDMSEWHTWGVIWTPTSITYTVDGTTWGTVDTASEIPSQPMTLDLQQQTWCASGWACPSDPQSLLVDWVAEYAPTPLLPTHSTGWSGWRSAMFAR